MSEEKTGTIQERLYTVIEKELGIDDSTRIKPEARFVNDLGADSLDIVELVMAIENEFDIEVLDDDADKMITVRAVLDYLNKHVTEE